MLKKYLISIFLLAILISMAGCSTQDLAGEAKRAVKDDSPPPAVDNPLFDSPMLVQEGSLFRLTSFENYDYIETEDVEIIEKDSATEALWRSKDNKFTEKSKDEVKDLFGLDIDWDSVEQKRRDSEQLKSTRYDLPDFFDWRDHHGQDYVTPVRDQESCGSCWAFAALASMEANANAFYNRPDLDPDLSEQDLVSCFHGSGCEGLFTGQFDDMLDYMISSEVCAEYCFPYTATNEDCANKCFAWQNDSWGINSWQEVPFVVDEIKNALITNGPLITGMAVYSDFMGYDEGIYYPTNDFLSGYHAIAIVGYGTHDGMDYWICKNSWGEDWGEDGYFRILAGESQIDSLLMYAIESPNPPLNILNPCNDADNDTYCNWGLGEKPDNCPVCDDYVADCDDSDPSIFENCGMLNYTLGTLNITSDPSDAKVFVKDEETGGYVYRGNTPLTFNLNSGVRGIKLSKEHYEDYFVNVTIDANVITHRDIVLLDATELFEPHHEIVRAGDIVEIIGTAPSHSGFQNYILEYAVEEYPSNWSDAGFNLTSNGNQSIFNGTLGVWDTSSITETDFYTIRLTVFGDGVQFEDSTIIFVDPTIKEGWPLKFDCAYFERYDECLPPGPFNIFASDLDKDGTMEVVIPTATETLGLHVLTEYGEVFEGDWPKELPQEHGMVNGNLPSPAIGDIDGDGYEEILIVNPFEDNRLYAFNHDGSSVEGFPILLPYKEGEDGLIHTYRASVILEDMNNDGNLEVVVWADEPGYLAIYYTQGEILPGLPYFFDSNTGSNLRRHPTIGNFDSDADLEIVFVYNEYIFETENYIAHIEVRNIDGTPVEGWPITKFDEYAWISPPVGDVDNDGDMDVVVAYLGGSGIYVYEKDGQVKSGWPQLEGKRFTASPILLDLNSDGQLEIVISNYGWETTQTYVLNSDGTMFEGGWPKNRSYYSRYFPVDFRSPFATKTPEGEGLIFEAAGSRIYGWNQQGEPLSPDFPKYAGGSVTEFALSSLDVDADGQLEIVGGSKSSVSPSQSADYNWRDSPWHYAIIWETDLNAGDSLEWPMFLRDAGHTGLYAERSLPPSTHYFYADYGPGVSEGIYDNVTGGGPCNQPGPCYGTDETDTAFCPDQNYCVLDGVCYKGDGTATRDIDGSDKHEAICVGYGWWDCDTGLPGMEVCELCGHEWLPAGEEDVGEYEWSDDGYGCCGDDENEYVIEGLCCNSVTDINFNGFCYTTYQYMRDVADPDAIGCDDVGNDQCVGGSDPDDSTYCLSEEECVYSGVCYSSCDNSSNCTLVDADEDGFVGAYCMADGSGQWEDCDVSQSICQDENYCGFTNAYASSGEGHPFGEYTGRWDQDCCGDDEGEYLIIGSDFNLCCDSPTDQIVGLFCIPEESRDKTNINTKEAKK